MNTSTSQAKLISLLCIFLLLSMPLVSAHQTNTQSTIDTDLITDQGNFILSNLLTNPLLRWHPETSKKTGIQLERKIPDITFSISKKDETRIRAKSYFNPSSATGNGESYKDYSISSQELKTPLATGNYQTNLFSGSAGYSFKIEVPHGVVGMEPAIIASYNHHSVNSLPSVLGSAGWSLNNNLIYRDTNYSISNLSDDYYRISFNGVNDRLVYVPAENRYHTKHETYFYIKNETGSPNTKGEYWVVKTKDGTVYRFGYNPDSELLSNLEDYPSVWHLDEVKDTHNNKISYHYTENPNSDTGTAYPDYISYNNGTNRIEFAYNYTITPPTAPFYTDGNEIKRSGILNEIIVTHNNSLVRKYVFAYSPLDSPSKLFLISIRQIGSDGISELPPTTFKYNLPEKGWQENSTWSVPPEAVFVKDGWKDSGVRMIDLDFDGLTDIAKMYNSRDMDVWINEGEGWSKKETLTNFFWENSAGAGFVGEDGIDNGVRFIDINGDLRTDIVRAKGGERLSRLNSAAKDDLELWLTIYDWVPPEADFVTFSGKIIGWEDCDPSQCPQGYKSLGVSCEGDYCTRTCSNKECGPWLLPPVWTSSYEESVYDSRSCSVSTEGFLFCDRRRQWGDFSCNQPQPYCYMLRYIGCGRKASSDVKSQSYYLDGNNFDLPSGCTNDEYDSSSWRCDQEAYGYCLPAGFNCSSKANCMTDCWQEGIGKGMEMADFRLRAWKGSCSDPDDIKADRQDCAATLEVYVSYVTGNDLTYQCKRKPIYELSADNGVRFADINGDYKSDILKANGKEAKTWLNHDKSWIIKNNWLIPQDARFVDDNGKDQGVRIFDINGDGLSDLMKSDSSIKKVWLNNGKGWIEYPDWEIPKEIEFSNDGSDTGFRVADINGDGLNDILKNKAGSTAVWVNKRDGWYPDSSWKIPLDADFTDSVVRVEDINGDGIADLIKGSNIESKTWINKANHPYLLTEIKNSFGGKIKIGYKAISLLDNTGDDSKSDLGFSGLVVSSITQDNGLNWSSTGYYSYEGGLYEPLNREFRGFNHVNETLPDNSVVEHFYHQDNARASLEYQTNIFDSYNNHLKKVDYLWESKEKEGYYVTQLEEVTDYTYDGWGED